VAEEISMDEIVKALGSMQLQLMVAQKEIESLKNENTKLKGEKDANGSGKERTGT